MYYLTTCWLQGLNYDMASLARRHRFLQWAERAEDSFLREFRNKILERQEIWKANGNHDKDSWRSATDKNLQDRRTGASWNWSKLPPISRHELASQWLEVQHLQALWTMNKGRERMGIVRATKHLQIHQIDGGTIICDQDWMGCSIDRYRKLAEIKKS